MNKLSIEKKTEIIKLLVEGNSIRSCTRILDVSKNTVIKLLVGTGKACLQFHSDTVVKVKSKRVQCDEIWSFVYSKNKNLEQKQYGIGNVWTWVAMDSDTKLVISWFAGQRDTQAAKFFMNDLWCRLRTRVQLTSDGLNSYVEAVADTFGGKVDFAQLVKQYSNNSDTEVKKEGLSKYTGAQRVVVSGNPERKHISTSHIERQNLTMRMHMRRFTRNTNAFSKKIDNHCYAIALHFVYYNFVKIHKTLRITPAMSAGITKRFMTIEDIVKLTL